MAAHSRDSIHKCRQLIACIYDDYTCLIQMFDLTFAVEFPLIVRMNCTKQMISRSWCLLVEGLHTSGMRVGNTRLTREIGEAGPRSRAVTISA